MDRSRFVDDTARRFVFDRAANAAPVVVIDGRISAIWDLVPAEQLDPESPPQLLVFPVAPIDDVSAERIAERARGVGLTRLGAEPDVRYVAGVVPLASRPVGAYARPLR
jgi:hypothetical protein